MQYFHYKLNTITVAFFFTCYNHDSLEKKNEIRLLATRRIVIKNKIYIYIYEQQVTLLNWFNIMQNLNWRTINLLEDTLKAGQAHIKFLWKKTHNVIWANKYTNAIEIENQQIIVLFFYPLFFILLSPLFIFFSFFHHILLFYKICLLHILCSMVYDYCFMF